MFQLLPEKLNAFALEKWPDVLASPIICKRVETWLGEGYYFWEDINDAHQWGRLSKTRRGKYEIYVAAVDFNNVLDTVFNREQYYFWKAQIDKVATMLGKKNKVRPTKNEINAYLKEVGQWNEVDGILFQDIPISDSSLVKDLHYRKRIQLVAFNLNIITNFTLRCTENC